MDEILRSRAAMVLATLGATVAVVGEILGVVGFATLDVSSPGTFTDLGHAHSWLFFAGSVLVTGAVGVATWGRIVEGHAAANSGDADVLELFGATVATVLLAVGSLVSAASTGTSAGDTVGAVGIGLWGVLALARAGRQNLAERRAAAERGGRTSALWLAVSVGLLLLAVGSGIGFDPSNQGSSMASGILSATGLGFWAAATALARSSGLLPSPLVPRVVAGLSLAVTSYVAQAVVAGVVFGPTGTVTGLRIGGSIILALLGMSLAVFGSAAWARGAALPAPGATSPHVPTADAPSDGAMTPPPAAFCTQCGHGLSTGARFCASCGAPVEGVRS